jgi:tripartite-type tricarboxylate transporter receptor subunit TctC
MTTCKTAAMASTLALTLAALALPAAAQDYPKHPIRIVVPIVAGGTVDLVARLVARGMSEEYGQPVIVDNKGGGATLIGMRNVIQSPPDGYTLLATANTLVSAAEFIPDAHYDPARDFTPITLTARVPMVLVVHPQSGMRTVADLIARARADPGQLSNASSGIGSTGFIAAELFSQQAGIRLLPVAYKGNAPALMDVIGGQVASMFDQVSTAGAYVKSGKLVALGVSTRTRSALLPDVPTIAEAGLPAYEDVTYNAILAPAGTPQPIVDKLFRTITRVMADPAVVKQLAAQGVEAHTSDSPAQFGAFIASQQKTYRALSGGTR